MIKSGLLYDYGIGFWGPHGHDGVWHIALAESFVRMSWQMPVFAGEALKNYHIGFDLLLAGLHKLTSIPISILYFQILPPIISLLIGSLTYIFVIAWKKSKQAALLSVFFVYFGGSFGWVVSILRGQGLGGESMFWSQQAVSTLINPPFALSLVFLLLGLICIQKKRLLLAILCFALLSQIKVYAFVLALGGLLISGQWKVFLGSLGLGLVLFLPLNRNSTSLLVWQPFWFLETMMGISDRFYWPKFYEAMLNYKSGSSLKFIPAYLLAFIIFWFGNLGTRAVKEILVLKWILKPKSVGHFEIFFASVILAGGIIPMFFLQAGTPWNTIQFLYYSLFFSSILAGVAMSKLRVPGLVLLVLLTIPTTIGTLMHYTPDRPPAMVSLYEVEALQFLSEQPQGTVLTYPFDKIKAEVAASNPPRPLYLYESTAYVSAFGKQPVFLEDQVNLDIMQYDWKKRLAEVEEFYLNLDQVSAPEYLRTNNISYIYWVKPQRAKLGDKQLGLTRIFENKEVDIWKVK